MTGPGAPSLQRLPSTAETHPPPPGAWCCCFGTRWWTEQYEPKGWRCATRHLPLHLRADQVWINDQPAPLPGADRAAAVGESGRGPGRPRQLVGKGGAEHHGRPSHPEFWVVPD
jgi:hypothetical protein